MKVKNKFQHLGTQLIVFYMVISLVVLTASSFFIYKFMLSIIKEHNETFLLQQFQQIDYSINGLINDVDTLSKFLLLAQSVERFLSYTPDKGEIEFLEMKKGLHAEIESYVRIYDFIDSIYIAGEVQGIIGGTDSTTLVHSNETWSDRFISLDIFRNSLLAFPDMIMQGGIEKTFYNPYMQSLNDGKIISMIRGVRPLYESLTSVVLIFNVDELYLSTLYAIELKADTGHMYIVDDNGVIVSSSNKQQVGTQSDYFSFIKNADSFAEYGSFDAVDESTQIVYYKLNDVNWYMLKEIPLAQFSDQIRSTQIMLVLVILVSLIVIFVISYFWLKKMTKPLHILSHKMQDMTRGELGVTFSKVPNNEFGMVIRRFNEMSLSIVDLIKTTNEMQEHKRSLEIEALQNQINPHFLYNTLNMVRWMASNSKSHNIVNTIVALGNMLRPVFTSKESTCTLQDELYYVENYITIINLRFSNSVKFSFDIDECDMEHTVPRFILQPLIENAVTAGRQEGQDIHIKIMAFEAAHDFVISVIDSGVGIDSSLVERLNECLRRGEELVGWKGAAESHGIGLYNVNKRIQLNESMQYGVRLVAREEGTEVQIRLPKQQSNG